MGATLTPPGVPVGPAEREAVQLAQRRLAIGKANRIRFGRIALIARVSGLGPRDSSLLAADMIEDPPELLASTRLHDFLCEIRRVGPSGADKICRATKVYPLTVLGKLAPGDRAAVCAVLRMRSQQISLTDGRANTLEPVNQRGGAR